jgi:lipid-A-disaccharide synthase
MAKTLKPCIAMVAGEASGDLLASLVIPGLQSHWAGVALHGIGGPKMKALGFDAWWPQEKLAVRGYVEVLRHYREITGIRKSLLHRLLRNPPDVFMGVDAPDFNLDLALSLKRRGIATMQFVCPSVWAWRAERLDKIRQSVDHVLCLFPFEPPLLQKHGIAATYVGHPLAKSIPLSLDKVLARQSLGVSSDQKLIALLPGSRTSEIEHMAPLFFAAARLLEKQYPGVGFVLPVAPGQMQLVQTLQLRFKSPQNLILLEGQSHTALAAADATMVASGTATLEAALFKCPMVIAYHMPWLSWQIIRRKRLQAWVGLPNILCQEFIVPELLQEYATPSALAKEIAVWLEAPNLVEKMKLRFTDLHQQLTQDTSGLVTEAVDKVMASHA